VRKDAVLLRRGLLVSGHDGGRGRCHGQRGRKGALGCGRRTAGVGTEWWNCHSIGWV
jgi:hypothetical protein